MPRRGKRLRLAKGIFADASGITARVEVAKQRDEARYPLGTPLDVMKAWQERRKPELRQQAKRRAGAGPGTFGADCERYLAAVKGMATYQWRADDIARWRRVLGDERRRDTITQPEIAAVLHRWFTEPRSKTNRTPYGASTVNHRRTALLHLYTTLDGPNAPNPVRGIKKFREPDPKPKGYSYAVIRKILAAVGGAKTRARLAVMAYTGLPPVQIMRVEPDHVDWRTRKVWVQGRRKGHGTQGRLYPLTLEGLKAFRALEAAKAWGRYSTSSARRDFQTACTAVGATIGTPYDLRHSFAGATYQASEQRAAQELLDHRDPRTSWRYIMGAVSSHIRAALPKLATAQRAPQPKRNGRHKRGATRKTA
jgi:integrase